MRLLLLGAAFLATFSGPTAAQTLQFGDPKPPPATDLTACRGQAQRLRNEAADLRSRAKSPGDAALLARARWREVAATLLDQTDPLDRAGLVLRGWALAESAPALDHALLAATGTFDAGGLSSVTDCSRAIEPLIGVLVEAGSSRPADPLGSGERFAHAEALTASDVVLAPLHDELIRLRNLSEREEPRLADRAALLAAIEYAEVFEHLDQTVWLGAVWKQHREHALGQVANALLHSENGRAGDAALAAIDQCVRRIDSLLGLPASARPRLEPYREVLLRWMSESLLTRRERPWSLLLEALDAMMSRRRQLDQPTQNDLRIASAKIENQSNAIETRIGELLASGSFVGPASDPEWATLIGQLRLNTELQQVLANVPKAVETLIRYDRRAPATIWPRLLEDARRFDDPMARARFTEAAEPLVQFHTLHGAFPGEDDWRSGNASVAEIVANARAAALARLDSVRRLRAAELIAGTAASAAAVELGAWRDLFRLVELRRRLPSPDAIEDAINWRSQLLLPEGLLAGECQRLDAGINRALAQSAGGVSFVHAVEDARRKSAVAIVAESLSRLPVEPGFETTRELAALLAVAHLEDGSGGSDGGYLRAMQWCVLHFEIARRTGPEGPPSNRVIEYANYLGARLADGEWSLAP